MIFLGSVVVHFVVAAHPIHILFHLQYYALTAATTHTGFEVRDECEQDGNHVYAASKFYQAYRDWCGSTGRKPQSQTAFKRALEKLNGVYQQRSSSGLQWHGIQPCLTY